MEVALTMSANSHNRKDDGTTLCNLRADQAEELTFAAAGTEPTCKRCRVKLGLYNYTNKGTMWRKKKKKLGAPSGYVMHWRPRPGVRKPQCGCRFGKNSHITNVKEIVTCSGCLDLITSPVARPTPALKKKVVSKPLTLAKAVARSNGIDYDKEAMAIVWKWMQSSAQHRPPAMPFDIATNLVNHVSRGIQEVLAK